MIGQGANGSSWSGRAGLIPNSETALDNAFQEEVVPDSLSSVAARAQTNSTTRSRRCPPPGVTVHVYAGTPAPAKPDAVLPNNWFSTHHDERIALYPMYSPRRRAERRPDRIASLRERYGVTGAQIVAAALST